MPIPCAMVSLTKPRLRHSPKKYNIRREQGQSFFIDRLPSTVLCKFSRTRTHRRRCSRACCGFFGRADQLPNRHIETIGNSHDVLDRDVAFASFDDTDIRAMNLAAFGELLLIQAKLEPLCSNDVAQVSLKKCHVHVEFAPCPTGIKGSTASR